MKKLPLLLIALSCVLFAGCKPKPAASAATHDKFVTVDELKPYIINLDRRVSALEDNNKEWVAIDPDSESYQQLWTPFGTLLVSTKSVTPYLDGYKVKVAIGNPYYVTFIGFKLSYWCVTAKPWEKYKDAQNEAKPHFDPSKPYEIIQKGQDTKTNPFDKFTPPSPSSIETDEFGGVLVAPPRLPDFASLRPANTEDRTETLYAGSWNEIEFTVAPATADDIRHLRMSIDLNDVRLHEIPNPQ